MSNGEGMTVRLRDTDVILKPLDGLLHGIPGFQGTALLGEGLVLLVLDVKELNDRATTVRQPPHHPRPAAT